MSAFATWLFLGLILPQLGVEREALKSERFLRMDRSADQNADDEWFVRMPKAGGHDTGNVSVFVSSGRVSAIVITTAQLKSELDELIEQDSRCKLMRGERYLCQLGGTFAAVDVEACGHFVVLYSDALPQSRAQRSAYCGPVKVASHDLGKPGSWIQPWLAPERSIPLMITRLALVVLVGSWSDGAQRR